MMMPVKLPVCIRPMRAIDVDEVHELDKLAYPIPWPKSVYQREVKATTSLFFVIESIPPGEDARRGLDRIFHRNPFRGRQILGFSGMWYVIDEAHVSTIAVHPEWHGNKLGELLFWNMMRHVFHLGVVKMTLEVRVSNYVAQSLYRKYGLVTIGLRKGYYSDNGEDAYMMINDNLDEPFHRWVDERGEELTSQFNLIDHALPEKIHAVVRDKITY